jgi:hypothetical protein
MGAPMDPHGPPMGAVGDARRGSIFRIALVLGVSIGIVLADLQLSKYWSNICHPMGGP